MAKWFLVLLTLVHMVASQQFLKREGMELHYNGQRVFLSGMNIAWHDYGMDFGEARYDCCTGSSLENYLSDIRNDGGNSVRIWIHCDGRMTPKFDGNGYVYAADDAGTFTSDIIKFLDAAVSNNILVTIVLWNGAALPTQPLIDLMWDDSKLDTYINNVLRPLVAATRGHVSLGSWEVMNEPEGSIRDNEFSAEPCYDTRPLDGSGAGWTGAAVPMERMLRFISRQVAAIRAEDTKALITVGSWSEKAQTDQYGFRNYYTDTCLQTASGDFRSYLDFYQMHTYESGGSYNPTSPMVMHGASYALDKPNIVGEYSEIGGDGRDITELHQWTYEQGYVGAWTWQANGGGTHSDNYATQSRALNHIRYRTDQGIVDFLLVP